MKIKTEYSIKVQQEFGRSMYRLGMSRRELVTEVSKRNGVSLKTIYKWLKGEDEVKVGVLLETLKEIEDEKKGA